MGSCQLNECLWTAASGGTGNLVVSTAVAGYYTPAQCTTPPPIDGQLYSYRAANGATEYMSGVAPYDVATTSLVLSDPSAEIFQSSNGGSAVSFTAPPTVLMGAAAQDGVSPSLSRTYVTAINAVGLQTPISVSMIGDLEVFSAWLSTWILDFSASDCPLLQYLDLSNAAGLSGAITLSSLPSLISLDIGNYLGSSFSAVSIASTLQSFGASNSALTSVTLTGCSHITDLDFSNSGVLPALNLTGLTSLASLEGPNCTSLTSVTVSASDVVSCLNVNLGGCALTQTAVDDILVALDGAGLSNGNVSLQGGTSSAPGTSGAAAKTSLIGKGWTAGTN